jgi:hypothetical protein
LYFAGWLHHTLYPFCWVSSWSSCPFVISSLWSSYEDKNCCLFNTSPWTIKRGQMKSIEWSSWS